MSTTSTPPSSTDNILCANCGKGEESSGDLKACTACKLVKYCNRECQIAHRPQHKKACKKRAAGLYDEQLFKEPPPREECPICMLPLPLIDDQTSFYLCCGKNICNGCVYALVESEGADLCTFCRTTVAESDEEQVKQLEKLTEKGNARAFYILGGSYEHGSDGLPQDMAKANELYLKAGELGCAGAYFNLGSSYAQGSGVTIDKEKAKHYYELAVMNGDIDARHNLGVDEYNEGNYHRAMKHFIISSRAGYKDSVDMVKRGYMAGHVTKEEYANTLREYQKNQDETKSEARDIALAVRNERMDG